MVFIIDGNGRLRHDLSAEHNGIYDYVLYDGQNCPEGYETAEGTIEDINGMYIPQWTGEAWVEGATEEEIKLINERLSTKGELFVSDKERIAALEMALLEMAGEIYG